MVHRPKMDNDNFLVIDGQGFLQNLAHCVAHYLRLCDKYHLVILNNGPFAYEGQHAYTWRPLWAKGNWQYITFLFGLNHMAVSWAFAKYNRSSSLCKAPRGHMATFMNWTDTMGCLWLWWSVYFFHSPLIDNMLISFFSQISSGNML